MKKDKQIKRKYKVGQKVEFIFISPPAKTGTIEEKYKDIDGEPSWWVRADSGKKRKDEFMKFNIPESKITKVIK